MNGPSSIRNHLLCMAVFALAAVSTAASRAEVPPTAARPWRALHLINHTTGGALAELENELPGYRKWD